MFLRNPAWDVIIVLLIVLLIFGPKRLPGLGKQLGQGLREFKEAITGDSKDSADQSPQITQSSATPITSDRQSAEVGSAERRS